MAFNPFTYFRKHKKVFFAGLTILCMFTFVICTGVASQGDLITRILGLTPPGRTKANKVATVNGSKVTDHNLIELRQRRLLANGLIQQLVFEGNGSVTKEIQDSVEHPEKSVNRFDEPDRLQLKQAATDAEMPRELAFGRMFSEQRLSQSGLSEDEKREQRQWMRQLEEMRMQGLPASLRQDQRNLELIANKLDRDQKPDEAKLVRQLNGVLAFTQWELQQRDGKASSFYFGGSTSPEELLDFIAWQKKADELGIRLTEKDVVRLANEEALNRAQTPLTSDVKKDKLIQRALASHQFEHSGIKPEEVLAALNDEYRVVFAQQAVLGTEPGCRFFRTPQSYLDRSPATATPEEFHNYYVENLTISKLALLPVPASAFLSEVKDRTPSDQVIQSLYDQYKNQEYSPERNRPGFKVPRQVRVEWVTARSDSPYYQNAGRESLRKAELHALLGQLVDPSFGGGVASATSSLAVLQVSDLNMQPAYKEFRESWPTFPYLAYRSLPTNYDAHTQSAAGVAQFLASSTTGGAALPALVVIPPVVGYTESSNTKERVEQAHLVVAGLLTGTSLSPMSVFTTVSVETADQVNLSRSALDKVAFEASAVLAGTNLSPLTSFSTASVTATGTPPVPPLSAVKDVLLERAVQKAARDRAVDDLKALQKEINELGFERSLKPKDAQERLNRELILARPDFRASGLLAFGWQGPLATLPWATYRPSNAPTAAQAASLFGAVAADPLPGLSRLAHQPEVPESTRFAYLTKHDISDLHTRFNIEQDSHLQFLKDIYTKSERLDDKEAKDFYKLFYSQGFQGNQPPSPHRPFVAFTVPAQEDSWAKSTEPVLYWNAEVKEPYVPTLQDARDQVIAAWRLQQARELARKEANRIRNELPKGAQPQVLRPMLQEQAYRHNNGVTTADRWGELFDILDVSRLKLNLVAASQTGHRDYEPYKVSEPQHMPYPPANFVDQVLGQLKQPGDALVLADQPETTFYVVVLDSRVDPSKDTFRDIYSRTPDREGHGLWEQFHQQRVAKYREEVLRQLRLEAGLIDASGNPLYHIDADLRKSLEGPVSGGDE